MATKLVMTTIVVKDYDEAISFYIQKLDFSLIEDTRLSDVKRWVVISPDVAGKNKILLARAADKEQLKAIGNQAGSRVAFFLNTDDFEKDYQTFLNNGVEFVRDPIKEIYGTVAVFKDLYGNLWDLIG